MRWWFGIKEDPEALLLSVVEEVGGVKGSRVALYESETAIRSVGVQSASLKCRCRAGVSWF